MTKQEIERLLKKAWNAGFEHSGEGHNHEWSQGHYNNGYQGVLTTECKEGRTKDLSNILKEGKNE